MDDESDRALSRAPELEDLLALCRALRAEGVRYLLIGGFAVILHGFVRTPSGRPACGCPRPFRSHRPVESESSTRVRRLGARAGRRRASWCETIGNMATPNPATAASAMRREAGREMTVESKAPVEPGPARGRGPTSMPAIPAAADVLLTPLKPTDAPELFTLTDANRAGLRRWLPWVDGVRHVEDTLQFILSAREETARGGGVEYAVKAAGRIVGVIGRSGGKLAAGSASLGYWISGAHQGRGLATASCRALITATFEQGFDRVEIRCADGNRRSRAVPIRLGLREEGRVLHAERLHGHFVDHVICAVRAADWRPNRTIGTPPARLPGRP